jgi:hypothetical protein
VVEEHDLSGSDDAIGCYELSENVVGYCRPSGSDYIEIRML